MNEIRTVALTGATGFIGMNLLGVLVRQGMEIRALYRSSSSEKRPDLPGISWIEGSLSDTRSLHSLLNGADVLVHCAGLTKASRADDFFEVNTEGTERLLDVTEAVPTVERFLFVSSLAARHPDISPYAESKLRAERIVEGASRVEWTIVRPPAVYGPGDRDITPLFKAMDRGFALVPAPESNRFSLLHVLDLAEAILELIQSRCATGQILELHDGTPGGYSWRDVIRIFESVKGRKLMKIRIPSLILKTAAVASVALSAPFPFSTPLTPWKVRELLHPDWVCTNGFDCSGLSWRPRFTLKLALENGLAG